MFSRSFWQGIALGALASIGLYYYLNPTVVRRKVTVPVKDNNSGIWERSAERAGEMLERVTRR